MSKHPQLNIPAVLNCTNKGLLIQHPTLTFNARPDEGMRAEQVLKDFAVAFTNATGNTIDLQLRLNLLKKSEIPELGKQPDACILTKAGWTHDNFLARIPDSRLPLTVEAIMHFVMEHHAELEDANAKEATHND